MCSYKCSAIPPPISLTHPISGLLAHVRVSPPCVRRSIHRRTIEIFTRTLARSLFDLFFKKARIGADTNRSFTLSLALALRHRFRSIHVMSSCSRSVSQATRSCTHTSPGMSASVRKHAQRGCRSIRRRVIHSDTNQSHVCQLPCDHAFSRHSFAHLC